MTTITTSQGAQHARILSVGAKRGSRIVDNAEMCTYIESTDEWIQQRTGIVERRWVNDEESVLSLAVDAARVALERAKLSPDQVGGIICATVSHLQQTPSLACLVANELGCGHPAAFDISAACAGFAYGVAQAEALVRSGAANNIVVIGVETISKLTNMDDRSTAFLFSDGAGAVVIGASETPGIGPVVWGSQPEDHAVIQTPAWDPNSDETPYIEMEGRAVFRWATTAIADKARECLRVAGLSPADLDVFIPHQANNRITDSMLRHLKLPDSVVVSRDITHMGNSSAASIPLAMDALLSSGEAKSGDTALIIGFGAGLVFAGQVVVLP